MLRRRAVFSVGDDVRLSPRNRFGVCDWRL